MARELTETELALVNKELVSIIRHRNKLKDSSQVKEIYLSLPKEEQDALFKEAIETLQAQGDLPAKVKTRIPAGFALRTSVTDDVGDDDDPDLIGGVEERLHDVSNPKFKPYMDAIKSNLKLDASESRSLMKDASHLSVAMNAIRLEKTGVFKAPVRADEPYARTTIIKDAEDLSRELKTPVNDIMRDEGWLKGHSGPKVPSTANKRRRDEASSAVNPPPARKQKSKMTRPKAVVLLLLLLLFLLFSSSSCFSSSSSFGSWWRRK
jgi:hypothetical protein